MSLPESALAGTGVTSGSTVHANLTAPGLYEHALRRSEGRLSACAREADGEGHIVKAAANPRGMQGYAVAR